METLCDLLKQTSTGIIPRGVLLFDAVPWLSTLKKGSGAGGDVSMPAANTIRGDHPEGTCVLASLRGESEAFNANGIVLELLARGMGTSSSSVDVKIIGARHGDFMCGTSGDLGGGVPGASMYAMRLMGILSDHEKRQMIQELGLAFIQSVLGLNPEAYAMEIERNKAGLMVSVVDNEWPDLTKKMPYFLN